MISDRGQRRLEIEVKQGTPIFLKDIPSRSSRPLTSGIRELPHCQLSENPREEIWKLLCSRIAESQKSLFVGSTGPKPSLTPLPDTLAFFLDGCPCKTSMVPRKVGTEWAHVHGKEDGSLHLVLSNADVETVICKNWGERHPILWMGGGGAGGFPEGLVLIYAPRTLEEIDTIIEILTASYLFARGDSLPLKYSA